MNPRPAHTRAGGFTLVELLVVIVVLGLLAGVVVFAMGGISTSSQQSACATDRVSVRDAIEAYRAHAGTLPADQDALVAAGNLDAVSTLHDFTVSGAQYTIVDTGACTATTTTDAPVAASGTTTSTSANPNAVVSDNDAWADAYAIAPLTRGTNRIVHFDATGATTEPTEPWIGGAAYASVWFRYTPNVDETVQLTTAGYTDASSWTGVYTGGALAALANLAQTGSQLSFAGTGGTTYWFQLFTQQGHGRAGTLTVRAGSATNDDFADADAITPQARGTVATVAIDASNATVEHTEPWIGDAAYASVWFSYTPSVDETVQLTTAGYTDASSWTGVYTGSTLASLAKVVQTGSQLSFTATANVTYRLQVFTQQGHGRAGTLTVRAGSNANDDFANAEAIAPLVRGTVATVAIDASFATVEHAEPWIGDAAYASVWFRYAPTADETIQLTTAGYTDASSWTGVYTGSSLETLQQVAQTGSQLSFTATNSTTYWFQVFTQQGHGRAGTLTVRAGSAGNDDFGDAQTIAALGPGSATDVAIDATAATVEHTEPWIGDAGYASVWFRYTPSSDQTVQLTTAGYTDASSWTGVYTGAALFSLQNVAQTGSQLSFAATAGTTYWFQVFTQQGHGRAGTLTVRAGSSGNDDYADAQTIAPATSGTTANVAIDVSNATVEHTEPWVGDAGYASVWFDYTPASTQTVQLTTAGYTDASSWTGVYTGGTLGALTQVTQGGNVVSFTATAGTTYRIQVFTQQGHGHAGTLTVHPT